MKFQLCETELIKRLQSSQQVCAARLHTRVRAATTSLVTIKSRPRVIRNIMHTADSLPPFNIVILHTILGVNEDIFCVKEKKIKVDVTK